MQVHNRKIKHDGCEELEDNGRRMSRSGIGQIAASEVLKWQAPVVCWAKGGRGGVIKKKERCRRDQTMDERSLPELALGGVSQVW